MKMKELERETGVGRETIRYYIREGLLPEPVRPKRNVASYGQEHVDRLKLIRRLQQERFLPLSVIKTIVSAQDARPARGIEQLIGLENLLGPLVADPRHLEPRRFDDVRDSSGLSEEEMRRLVEIGFLHVDERDGVEWLNSRNARLVDLIAEGRKQGFSPENGYEVDSYGIYAELTDVLARRAVVTFYENVGDKFGQEEAAELAAKGIRLLDEMLPLLRIEKIVREIKRLSDEGELPGGRKIDV